MEKKRGRPVKHKDIPEEIRENINEANLPEVVLEAIANALSPEVAEKAKLEDSKKDPSYIGNCPVTGKPLFE
ncbi:MAG: hypothetical protein ACK5X3_18110 [Pseudomonadota bacterium]|jgi:hypothetical protein